MNNLLIINAHPQSDSEQSFSLNAFRHFMKSYNELKPDDETIEQINLYEEAIPLLDQTLLSAWEKGRSGLQLTREELEAAERSDEILRQFKRAGKYVIVYPLHNFNIPSKLKDYMDNILIARETFKYTDTGSIGLLKDGRKMLLIQGSGSIYTRGDWYTEVEYSYKYLKSMFNFLGIEDFDIVRVQGTSILDKDDILQKAYKEAVAAAYKMAVKGSAVIG
ncbi:MAG: FMN-dependent NADH-azoreductase [Paenibacillus sp.]|nr:FMN-dependent NADH-azoreductase [Paenibacillus sp.]